MRNRKKIILCKRIQCILGIIFLIPPVIGFISFMLFLINIETTFMGCDKLAEAWEPQVIRTTTSNLSTQQRGLIVKPKIYDKTPRYYTSGTSVTTGSSSSSMPIYWGLMAVAGCILIKDNLQYIFLKKGK